LSHHGNVQASPEAAKQLTGALARGLTAEGWMPWLERGLRVLVILGLAWALTRIARRLFQRLARHAAGVLKRHAGGSQGEIEKRTATIVAALTKAVATAVWIVALVMALHEFQFNIQPLLAGLGLAGLAFGLGAQTLIRDWLGGFFLLIEDQIRIGDAVSINGIAGAVEEINLRTTLLRSENGAVHIIPNGGITQISNFTREYSYYVFETTLWHGADVSRALGILRETAEALAAEPEFEPLILAPVEVLGVERLTERGALIRARIKTLPAKQARVGRELNRRVKEHFDAAGIEFPRITH
jgi:small conductance mechanosensitive channel